MSNLVSFNFNPRDYREEDYRTRLMGTSDCNMFVPFFSIFAHDLLVFEDQENLRVMEYSLPSIPPSNRYERQYARMGYWLKQGVSPKRYNFKLRGVDHFLSMHRGLLYNDTEIFMCLGVNTEYLLNTPMEEIQNNPDLTQFSLFISNDFDTNPTYKNIRKKVEELYITPFKRAGVDVIQTSRIKTWLFSNNFKQPKFKSVTKMMKYLQEEVPRTLLIE